MNTLLANNSTKRRRLARGIALLFLLYTAIDLTSPELCKGDTIGDSWGIERSVTLAGDQKNPGTAFVIQPSSNLSWLLQGLRLPTP